jgi:hypothetical protein
MSIPQPKIKTKFFDPKRKITFVVCAYRKVNRAEAEIVFARWRALNPRKKLPLWRLRPFSASSNQSLNKPIQLRFVAKNQPLPPHGVNRKPLFPRGKLKRPQAGPPRYLRQCDTSNTKMILASVLSNISHKAGEEF